MQSEENLYGSRITATKKMDEKDPGWEYLFVRRVWGRYHNGRKEKSSGTYVTNRMKQIESKGINISSVSCLLGHVAWLQIKSKDYWTVQERIRIVDLSCTIKKLSVWEKSHVEIIAGSYDRKGHTKKYVVKFCKNGKQKIRVNFQNLDYVCRRSSFQKGRFGNRWKLSNICCHIIRKCL